MAGAKLFKFEKEALDSIYESVKDVYRFQKGKLECVRGLLVLEKLINTNLDGFLSEKDQQEIQNNAYDEFTHPQTVEHVLDKLIVLLNRSLLPSRPRVSSGLAAIYSRLPMKPDRENSSIMDVIDEAYMAASTPDERTGLGTQQYGPATELHQAMGKDDNRSKKLLAHLYAKQYEWPIKSLGYALVWVCRNMDVHKGDLDTIGEKLLKRGYWSSLIDCCLRYEKEINERFRKSMIESIDFASFKASLKNQEREEFFEKKFTQLHWGDKKIVWPANNDFPAVMLIGEAGAGKSTQMERLYWDVINSNKSFLPVWIQVKDLPAVTNDGENKLIACIKEKLGEYADWYEELMQEGLVLLFLDGLNELLVNDREASKQQLLNTIQSIRDNYKTVKICMTDRHVDIPMKYVSAVYSCASMDEEACMDYCIKYYGEVQAEQIVEFIDIDEHPENKWFLDAKEPITPEKLNALADMILTNMSPKTKEDFYFKYVDRILIREQYEKSDGRIPCLKGLLHDLTMETKSFLNYQYGMDIVDIFVKKGNMNKEMAYEYYNLARRIPLIVEDGDKYRFVHYSYYAYFKRKDIM